MREQDAKRAPGAVADRRAENERHEGLIPGSGDRARPRARTSGRRRTCSSPARRPPPASRRTTVRAAGRSRPRSRATRGRQIRDRPT